VSPVADALCYSESNAAVSQYTLSVRKPTTDFLTWDRTQAALDTSAPGPTTIRTDRIHAWGMFHYLARQQQSNSDLALEDRAVGSLTIKLNGVWPTQPAQTPIKVTADPGKVPDEISWDDGTISPPSGDTTKVETPGHAIDLVFKTVDNDQATPAARRVDSSWEITLPPGSVIQVQLRSNVKKDLDKHFAMGILDGDRTYTLLVETANQAMPSRSDLYNAFEIRPPLEADTTTVNFNLALPTTPDASWAQLSRVDLQSQVWRWDGRPSAQFPFSTVVPIPYGQSNPVVPKQTVSTDLLNWELDAFAVRRATDLSTRPMKHVQIPAPTGASTKKKAQAASPLTITAFQANDDRATEVGATYYRLAEPPTIDMDRWYRPNRVRCHRWIKIKRRCPAPTAIGQGDSFPPVSPLALHRRTTSRPSRPIKYIVPLTGATTATQPAASSVLVVVQGPWYAIAGLAEDISACITQSAAPVSASDPVSIPEAGADPILFDGTTDRLPTTFDEYGPLYPSEGVKNPLFHGPVGHTFDQSDVNPLWVTSSFVLDPPGSNQGPAQEGTFARVQFSRIIHQNGIVILPEQKNGSKPTLTVPPADFESDLTDPVWVQFLPSRFLPLKQPFDKLSISYDAPSNQVSVVAEAKPISLTLNSYSLGLNVHHLVFGLLLTQQVNDMLGRPNQERFIDLLFLKPSGNEETTAMWPYSIPKGLSPTDLIGRVVVIQRQVDTSAGCGAAPAPWPCDLTTRDELWKEMFPGMDSPDQKASDAAARILAVSPPIPANAVSKRVLNCAQIPPLRG
jgi:hypothetical protein